MGGRQSEYQRREPAPPNALPPLDGHRRTHRRRAAPLVRAAARPDRNPDDESAHAVSDGVTRGLIRRNRTPFKEDLRIPVMAGEMHRPGGCRGGSDERQDHVARRIAVTESSSAPSARGRQRVGRIRGKVGPVKLFTSRRPGRSDPQVWPRACPSLCRPRRLPVAHCL